MGFSHVLWFDHDFIEIKYSLVHVLSSLYVYEEMCQSYMLVYHVFQIWRIYFRYVAKRYPYPGMRG